MEVYYCPQVFVCYAELRRRDPDGLRVNSSSGRNAANGFQKESVLMALNFHSLWKLCGKCVFVHVGPGFLSGDT